MINKIVLLTIFVVLLGGRSWAFDPSTPVAIPVPPAPDALGNNVRNWCDDVLKNIFREQALANQQEYFRFSFKLVGKLCEGIYEDGINTHDEDTGISLSVHFEKGFPENSWEILYDLYRARPEKMVEKMNKSKTIYKVNKIAIYFAGDDKETVGLRRIPEFHQCFDRWGPVIIEMKIKPTGGSKKIINRIKAAINNIDKLKVH